MAKLYVLKKKTFDRLYSEEVIKDNLDQYRPEGTIPEFKPDDISELQGLSIDDDLQEEMLKAATDLKKAILLYENLSITPLLASDEKFWTYLSHGPLQSVVKQRWDFVKAGDEVSYVRDHWFSKKGVMTDALASLWWSVEISKISGDDPYQLTEVLFRNYSLRVTSFTRVLRMRNVMHGILQWIYENYEGSDGLEHKGVFIAKYLNQLAGVKLINSLTPEQIMALLDEVKDVIVGVNSRADVSNKSASDIIVEIRERQRP